MSSNDATSSSGGASQGEGSSHGEVLPTASNDVSSHSDGGIDYMAFSGGGVLGTAYVGLIEVFEEKGVLNNLKGVSGTSAGSIVAGALSCNARASDISKIMNDIDYGKFKDDSFWFGANIMRLVNKLGWYKGDYFEKWYSDILNELTGVSNITLYDVKRRYNKEVVICSFNLDNPGNVEFSSTSHPELELFKAARMSMSVPGLFTAYKYNGDRYVDGGVTANYPLYVWKDRADSMRIGAKLITNATIEMNRPVNGIIDAAERLIGVIYDTAQKKHESDDDWKCTVPIYCGGISSLNFNIGNEEKARLIDAGRKAALEFRPPITF